MKILLPIILLFISFTFIASITSCKKNNVTTVTVSDNSILGLLTEKQWQFDTLYSNYTGPGTGTVSYARGGIGNTINEDNIRDVYWKDGNADYFDNFGNYQHDTWRFTNSDSTTINLTLPASSIDIRIIKLDATHYTAYDSTDHTLDVQVYLK